MTSAPVLATQQARDAGKQLLAMMRPLKEPIAEMVQQGNVFADANQWDGSLAQQAVRAIVHAGVASGDASLSVQLLEASARTLRSYSGFVASV